MAAHEPNESDSSDQSEFIVNTKKTLTDRVHSKLSQFNNALEATFNCFLSMNDRLIDIVGDLE